MDQVQNQPSPQTEPNQAQTSGTPTPSATPQVSPDEDEKFFAALGYFGPLFILSLIVKPQSLYCKFHAKQSMVLFIGTLIFLFILGLIPWFGSLLTLVLFAVYVLAIYRAYHGDLWNIPFVASLAGKVDVQKMYEKAGLAVSNLEGLKEVAGGVVSKVEQMGQKLTESPKTPPEAQPPQQNPPQQPPQSSTPEQSQKP